MLPLRRHRSRRLDPFALTVGVLVIAMAVGSLVAGATGIVMVGRVTLPALLIGGGLTLALDALRGGRSAGRARLPRSDDTFGASGG